MTPLFALSPEGSVQCDTSWIVNLIGDKHKIGIEPMFISYAIFLIQIYHPLKFLTEVLVYNR